MKLPEYRSIAEKKSKYLYVQIDDKTTLDSHLRNLLESNPRCIFRGVRKARYKFFTSVQREWIANGLGRHMAINQLVNSLIRDMRKNRVLNDYFTSMNIVQTDFLYLSLLQHYSAPTTTARLYPQSPGGALFCDSRPYHCLHRERHR